MAQHYFNLMIQFSQLTYEYRVDDAAVKIKSQLQEQLNVRANRFIEEVCDRLQNLTATEEEIRICEKGIEEIMAEQSDGKAFYAQTDWRGQLMLSIKHTINKIYSDFLKNIEDQDSFDNDKKFLKIMKILCILKPGYPQIRQFY